LFEKKKKWSPIVYAK